MINTDFFAICVVQMAILIFAVFAVIRDWRIRILERYATAKAEVNRSDRSMTTIFTVYGAAIASCLVLIDKASGINENKVLLIVLDFLCLTYLFFFSTWFRNSIFFPLLQRVRKD